MRISMYISTYSSLQDTTNKKHCEKHFHSHKQKLLFCMRERKKAMDSCSKRLSKEISIMSGSKDFLVRAIKL